MVGDLLINQKDAFHAYDFVLERLHGLHLKY